MTFSHEGMWGVIRSSVSLGGFGGHLDGEFRDSRSWGDHQGLSGYNMAVGL